MNRHDNYQQPSGNTASYNFNADEWWVHLSSDVERKLDNDPANDRAAYIPESKPSQSKQREEHTPKQANEELVNHFLNSVGDNLDFDISSLEDSSISLEEIADNEHAQQLAIGQVALIAREIYIGKDSPILAELSADKIFEKPVLAETLKSICSTSEGKQLLIDSINKSGISVQELGDFYASKELDNIDKSFKEHTPHQVDDASSVNIAKYNDVFKKLGWEPFKEDKSLAKLLCMDKRSVSGDELDKKSIFTQNEACRLGLVDPNIVDRLYSYQYRILLNNTKNTIHGLPFDESAGFVISANLIPSGTSSTANYWYEQSKYLGADAMRTCMESIIETIGWYQSDQQESILSSLVDEEGILKDAFFNCRGGDPATLI